MSARTPTLLFCLLLGCAHAPKIERKTYALTDITADYLAFWERHELDALDEQVDAFVVEVANRHPALYSPAIIGIKEGELKARLKIYFPMITPRLDEVRANVAQLGAALPEHQRVFEETFDDFNFRGRVIFMGAVGGFDGATRVIDGELALLFGVDDMVLFQPKGARLAPFFHHELFHLYHQQVMAPALASASGPARQILGSSFASGLARQEETILAALWREGLAVCVASTLNPDAKLEELSLPDALRAAVDARRAELAGELLERLQDPVDRQQGLYPAYFLGKQGGRVPSRAGYYLGYLVARSIAEHEPSLKSLARLHGEALEDAVKAALEELTQ